MVGLAANNPGGGKDAVQEPGPAGRERRPRVAAWPACARRGAAAPGCGQRRMTCGVAFAPSQAVAVLTQSRRPKSPVTHLRWARFYARSFGKAQREEARRRMLEHGFGRAE
jgi:hypothetical protein